MNIIYDKVDTGKTRKLIEESARTGYVIVTLDPYRVKRLKEKAQAYGIVIKDPVDWYSAYTNHVSDVEGYLIDDLDKVLEMLLRTPVKGFTMTQEDE